MSDSGLRHLVLCALLGLLLSDVAFAEPHLRVVAKTGDPAPGTGPFGEFHAFATPEVDASGDAAFFGTIQGAVLQGGTQGIWSERSGVLAQRARAGLDLPDIDGAAVYGEFFGSIRLAEDGTLAFVARMGTDPTFLIYELGAAAQLLQRVPNYAPGLPDGVDLVELGPVSYAGGVAAFRGFLDGVDVTDANDRVVYVTSWAGTTLVVRSGETAPGSSSAFDDVFDPMTNAAGHVAFDGVLADVEQSLGFWAQDATGEVQAVLLPGDGAPGLPGLTVGRVDGQSWNGEHQVLFQATLLGPGVDASNSVILYQGPIGAPAKLARYGDTAPGTGAAFGYFRRAGMDGDGRVTFIGDLVTGNPNNDSGIWSGTPDDVQLVVRENEPAPGTGGALFADFTQLALNRAGDFAFAATLRGSAVTAADDTGIWRVVDGEMELVLREGAGFEVAPGDARVVSYAAFGASTAPDGGDDAVMNDAGALALSLIFADDDQAVVVAPEPEQSAVALAAIALLVALRARSGLRNAGSTSTPS